MKQTCPLVKSRVQKTKGLPKLKGKALAAMLAFGAGLMVAAMSSGFYV